MAGEKVANEASSVAQVTQQRHIRRKSPHRTKSLTAHKEWMLLLIHPWEQPVFNDYRWKRNAVANLFMFMKSFPSLTPFLVCR